MGANQIRENASNSRITLYIFAAVLFLTPLFQGLFFRHEIYRAGLAVGGLFIWYLWTSKEKLVNDFKSLTMLDIGILGLLLAYVASSFTAVKALDAVDTDLKMAICLMVYIIVVGLSRTLNDSRNLIKAIYYPGVVVSIIGLAAFAGADITGAVLDGRISSTFQYPNALGGYLGVVGILGTYLLVTSENGYCRHILVACNLLVFTTLFGTSSRGTFIALAVAYLIFIAFQPSMYRLKIFGTLMLNFTLGGAAGYLIGGKAGSIAVWGYLALMTSVNVAVNFGIGHLKNSGVIKGKKVVWTVLLTMLVAGLAGSFLIINQGFINRITDINLTDRNVVERGYFYIDAFKIIKDHPLLGVGGGGWRSVYKTYQSYGYISTQVHNFYLQTWVEAGVLGIVSVLLIIIGSLWMFTRKIRIGSELGRATFVTIMSSILVIAVQSGIDFTLSYGAIGIILWTLFASLRSPMQGEQISSRSSDVETGSKSRVAILGGITLALAVIMLCFSLIIGFMYEEKAMEALKNKDIDKRLNYLTMSAAFNPFYADNYANLALIERKIFKKDKNPEHLKKALSYTTKAVMSDKGNPAYRVERINALFALKDFDSVVKEAEMAFRLAPWDQESYNLLAYVYLSAGKHYLDEGDKNKAKIYFKKTINIPKLLNYQMKKLTPAERKIWVTQKPTFNNKKLQKYVAEAIVLGQSKK